MDSLAPAEPLSSPGDSKGWEGTQASKRVSLLIQRGPTAKEASPSVPLGRLHQTEQQGGQRREPSSVLAKVALLALQQRRRQLSG